MSDTTPPATVVIFRSRLRPEAQAEYDAMADEIDTLARAQPGIVAFKTFKADDGERVTIAEFADAAAADAWRVHPRHRDAQRAGRSTFYGEYRLQVCDVRRDYAFRRPEEDGAGIPK
jgi:heme-degrading monooxygenase HmoA